MVQGENESNLAFVSVETHSVQAGTVSVACERRRISGGPTAGNTSASAGYSEWGMNVYRVLHQPCCLRKYRKLKKKKKKNASYEFRKYMGL